jgi:hypothetical protein
VKKIVDAYGRLDITKVETECNRVREEYLAKWKAETGDTVEGTDIKRTTAIEEAEPKFELWKPTKITLVALDVRFGSVNSSTAPQVTATDLSRQSTIYTLMRWITKSDKEHFVIDPFTGSKTLTLADSTIHELLHASGEIPPKHDGVVRQTWIGIKAVKPLLGRI